MRKMKSAAAKASGVPKKPEAKKGSRSGSRDPRGADAAKVSVNHV